MVPPRVVTISRACPDIQIRSMGLECPLVQGPEKFEVCYVSKLSIYPLPMMYYCELYNVQPGAPEAF